MSHPAHTRPDQAPAGGFAAGTMIRTLWGFVLVERLMAGDIIIDAAGALHSLRAVTQRSVGADGVVDIDTCALRHGELDATLSVAADQEVMFTDWRTRILGAAGAVPVAAHRLRDGVLVRYSRAQATQVFALQFDAAVVIVANGLHCRCIGPQHVGTDTAAEVRATAPRATRRNTARGPSIFQKVSVAGQTR